MIIHHSRNSKIVPPHEILQTFVKFVELNEIVMQAVNIDQSILILAEFPKQSVMHKIGLAANETELSARYRFE